MGKENPKGFTDFWQVIHFQNLVLQDRFFVSFEIKSPNIFSDLILTKICFLNCFALIYEIFQH